MKLLVVFVIVAVLAVLVVDARGHNGNKTEKGEDKGKGIKGKLNNLKSKLPMFGKGKLIMEPSRFRREAADHQDLVADMERSKRATGAEGDAKKEKKHHKGKKDTTGKKTPKNKKKNKSKAGE